MKEGEGGCIAGGGVRGEASRDAGSPRPAPDASRAGGEMEFMDPEEGEELHHGDMADMRKPLVTSRSMAKVSGEGRAR